MLVLICKTCTQGFFLARGVSNYNEINRGRGMTPILIPQMRR